MKKRVLWLTCSLLLAGLSVSPLQAETMLTPWGNLHGVRVGGEWVEFEAGLRIVQPDWSGYAAAVKYLQRPRYVRSASQRTVESRIAGVAFREVLTDTVPGQAVLTIEVEVVEKREMAGIFFCVDLPGRDFGDAKVQVMDSGSVSADGTTGADAHLTEGLPRAGQQVRIAGWNRTVDLRLERPVEVRLRRDQSNRATALNDPRLDQPFMAPPPGEPGGRQVYLKLLDGTPIRGDRASLSLAFEVTAVPDPEPVELTLDPSKPGRRFDGIGGNFRLQFPKTDPAVIGYCLDHLPVSWGRVELPWAPWHPDEDRDPLVVAGSGGLDRRVEEAMAMARTLTRRGMPVIVSVWSVPRWARAVNQPAGLRGTALNPAKSKRIVDSLVGALAFLKERYGVEAALFSFNEPETGVEVRQTPAEHVEFLWQMGQRLQERGLATRLLLGDTAHGTPAALQWITPGLDDPRLRGYLGAVAFHTWRGCTTADLELWRDAALRLGVPLLVTESGPDARLHEYPRVRLEPWFQLQEIDLYVRICAVAQPGALMPWQLTTDYSVLGGGGVYGEEGPLEPTQRFWNLKQLGLTPRPAFSLPLASNRREVTSAAFGDLTHGIYAIHLVNNGGPRRARLKGLPLALQELRVFVTDATRGMAEGGTLASQTGRVEFDLPAASYVTLLGRQP